MYLFWWPVEDRQNSPTLSNAKNAVKNIAEKRMHSYLDDTTDGRAVIKMRIWVSVDGCRLSMHWDRGGVFFS